MSWLANLIFAHAQSPADDPKFTLKLPSSVIGVGGVDAAVQTAVDIALAFLAAMAFAGIIYSGVMMITAGGDAAKFAQGRKNLIWAIIGIIVVVLSYAIIREVYILTGNAINPPASPATP